MPVSSEKTAKELYQDAVQLDQSGDQSPDVAKRARELLQTSRRNGSHRGARRLRELPILGPRRGSRQATRPPANLAGLSRRAS